jgi:hypothetical protein
MKISPFGAGWTDGQTNMTKLTVLRTRQKNRPAWWTMRQCFPYGIFEHPLRIQGRSPITLSEIRDFPQTPYSTFKYPTIVSFLALSCLANPTILRTIYNTNTAAATTSLDNLRLTKYNMKSCSLKILIYIIMQSRLLSNQHTWKIICSL